MLWIVLGLCLLEGLLLTWLAYKVGVVIGNTRHLYANLERMAEGMKILCVSWERLEKRVASLEKGGEDILDHMHIHDN